MLTLNNVSAGYGYDDIIKNISFEATDNISIIGPNGCGKTTLLRAIANIIPSRGSILIQGKTISDMKQREISKKIAMLTQLPSVYFSYNVISTVMMGRYLHLKNRFMNTPTKEDWSVVEESLKAVNMLEEKDKDILQLSGGQLQRVFLARVLAQEPKIILLDEPTNNLDLKCQVEIMDYLKKWTRKNERIVISVLHDINLALDLSERLLVMKNGEIHTDAGVEDILANGLLNNVYDMDVKEYMKKTYKRWNGTRK